MPGCQHSSRDVQYSGMELITSSELFSECCLTLWKLHGLEQYFLQPVAVGKRTKIWHTASLCQCIYSTVSGDNSII